MEEIIRNSLKADIPLLLLAESGWGKSSRVFQVAEEENLPVVDIRLSGYMPEDVQGIMRPNLDNTFFSYLPPDWAVKYKDIPFILFADEINQALIPVLHAFYKVVLDRKIGDIHLPHMKIIASGNLAHENPFLTDLPTPLIKRFDVVELENDHNAACNYLNKIYKVELTEIYTNPRQTEMALKSWFRNKDKNAVIRLGGSQLLDKLLQIKETKGEELIKQIEIYRGFKRNGIELPKNIPQEILDALDY